MFDIHKLITHIEKAILAFIAAFTVYGVGLEIYRKSTRLNSSH